jgi:hypothetical protein
MSPIIQIHGIFDFVTKNKEMIAIEIEKTLKGNIVNYKKERDQFNVSTTRENDMCTIETLERGSVGTYTNFIQGHVNVRVDDRINYSNNSKEVQDILLELYTIHKRDSQLKQLVSAF